MVSGAGRDLERRTLVFAAAVVDFVTSFQPSKAGEVISFQLLKSGTSIGANYREANRAESKSDFIHKTALTQKECAETDYWIELCLLKNIGSKELAATLSQEARELLAIFTTINRKAKNR